MYGVPYGDRVSLVTFADWLELWLYILVTLLNWLFIEKIKKNNHQIKIKIKIVK